MAGLGRALVAVGLVLVVTGVLLSLAGPAAGRIPLIGRLPGDIHLQRGNWSFYFPLTTSVVVSLLLTLVLSLWSRR
jgi:hypothetical protein